MLVILFAIFGLKNGATLTYVPKITSLVFANDVYTAKQSAGSGELSYSIVKFSGEKYLEVPASGEEVASVKASGRVVIYNEQSVPQQLVKTTRLETPEGKIFRIGEDVTIPAKGSLELSATADLPGDTYNVGLTDFTLPGLKGTPRFDKVYGRSKTAMSGGFSGTRKKVDQVELAKARGSLETSLKEELLSKARNEVPTGFILPEALLIVDFELLPIQNSSGDSATLTLKGNLSAPIFKSVEFANYVASQKLKTNEIPGDMDIGSISSLKISIPESGLASTTVLRISLSGAAEFISITNESALAADLAGNKKSELDRILTSYPTISEASAVVRPFWKSTFPSDPIKIKIEKR